MTFSLTTMQPPPKLETPSNILNRDAALRRLGGDAELFSDMAQFFFEDSPGLIAEIEDGIRDHNYPQATRAAHSLRGLAANFDAHAVIQSAQAIEQCSRPDEFDGLGKTLQELRSHVKQLNEALEPYRPL